MLPATLLLSYQLLLLVFQLIFALWRQHHYHPQCLSHMYVLLLPVMLWIKNISQILRANKNIISLAKNAVTLNNNVSSFTRPLWHFPTTSYHRKFANSPLAKLSYVASESSLHFSLRVSRGPKLLTIRKSKKIRNSKKTSRAVTFIIAELQNCRIIVLSSTM